jgi:hypothetical protein
LPHLLWQVESQVVESYAGTFFRAGEHTSPGTKGTVGELPGGTLHGAKRAINTDQSRASRIAGAGPHLVAALLDSLCPEPLLARCHDSEFSESLALQS